MIPNNSKYVLLSNKEIQIIIDSLLEKRLRSNDVELEELENDLRMVLKGIL